jgi:hypothetical protein
MIMGELGVISLFDLAQLLALNRATGTLFVVSNHRQGFFQFEHGQIANARDERMQEGEDAACRLFGWGTGSFEFRADPPVGGGRTIHDSTESLMLEAARRLDEAGATRDGTLIQSVQSHASRLRAMHERHRPVPSDATGAPDRAASFAALQAAGDALLYRAHQHVRLYQGGHWHEIGERPLTPAEFAELRDTFFDAGGNTLPRDFIVREASREILVSHLPGPGEALFVRAVVQLRAEMRDAA